MTHQQAQVGLESEEDAAPSVLIVDDDPAMRLLLRQALERDSYTILEAVDGDAGLTMCREYRPDLVLMDAVMPVMDGFRACAELKQLDQTIPVLITTGLDDDESIKKAFEHGAHDFIPKPIHWALLRQRVARVLHESRAEKTIAHLAYHDPLTGLPNRQLFMDRCGAALSRARRNGSQLALLFVDMDRFKQINDSLGHNVGDGVLRQSAERLVAAIREGDTVARLGGDEFIVLLEGVYSAKDIAAIAEKIIAELEKPVRVQGNSMTVGASIGIALFPNDGNDITTLLQSADSAMYRAKRQGRNGYQFHAKEISNATLRRLLLAGNLQKAQYGNEFELHFQPQLRLRNGERHLVGLEALVRWQHPELGLIHPNEFISLAEEMGLVASIGEWILRQACKQGVAWRDQGFDTLHLAVNLSLLQLRQRELPAIVDNVLRETGFDPERLELELPQSALQDSPELIQKTLVTLHDLGVRLTLDDFGTQSCSLMLLRQLPFSGLKIGHQLVHSVPDDAGANAVIQATLAIAKSFGLNTVAQGVETKAQLDYLLRSGCYDVQGFLFCEPRPEAELALDSLLERLALP